MTALVADDIARTCGLTLACRVITYQEWTAEWPAFTNQPHFLKLGAETAATGYDDETESPGANDRVDDLVVELRLEGNNNSFTVASVWNDEGRLAAIADRAQDMVMHELWTAWPVCADHAHPLRPAVADEGAYWTCPTTGRPITSIGSLPTR